MIEKEGFTCEAQFLMHLTAVAVFLFSVDSGIDAELAVSDRLYAKLKYSVAVKK